MDRIITQSYKVLTIIFVSFILIAGALYSANLNAENTPNQPPGTQLAFYVGFHSYNYGGYYRPQYVYYGNRYRHRNVYWTGWRYMGNGCQRTCLINRWNGEIIRCQRRC